jgi:hypothetical protein
VLHVPLAPDEVREVLSSTMGSTPMHSRQIYDLPTGRQA